MAAADGPNPFQHPPHVPVGCMLPVLDVLNHRPRTPIAWLRLADRVAFVCEPGFAGAPAGAEVFNNYGAKSNEELLLGFGFVLAEPRNEHDTLSLAVAPITAPAPLDHAAVAAGDEEEREELERSWRARADLAFLIGAAELPSRFVCRRQARRRVRADADGHGAGGGGVADSDADPVLPQELLMLMRAGSLCRLQLALAAGACRASGSPRAAARALLSRGLSASVERRALEQLLALFERKRASLELAQPWLLEREGEVAAPAVSSLQGAAPAEAAAEAAPARRRMIGPGDLSGAGSAASELNESAAALPASAGVAAADPRRAEYRRGMARVYVRGQHDILLDALSEVEARLQPELLAAQRFVLPAGACALEVGPGAAGLPTSALDVGGGSGGSGDGDCELEAAAVLCADCADEEEADEDEDERAGEADGGEEVDSAEEEGKGEEVERGAKRQRT